MFGLEPEEEVLFKKYGKRLGIIIAVILILVIVYFLSDVASNIQQANQTTNQTNATAQPQQNDSDIYAQLSALRNDVAELNGDIKRIDTDADSAYGLLKEYRLELSNMEATLARMRTNISTINTTCSLGNQTVRIDRLAAAFVAMDSDYANLTVQVQPEPARNKTRAELTLEIIPELRYQANFDCYWQVREHGYGKYLLVNELCATRSSAFWEEACSCSDTICEFNQSWC